jgi:hypothetical protein
MADSPHALAWNDDGWAEAFADALRAQRARVREFLAALGERQRRAEAELESWLETQPARVAVRTEPSSGVMDWEAEKRRMLAALEAEGEEGTEPATGTRIEIDEVVHRTELLVADKNTEIAELKRLLQDQTTSLGSVAVGAAAVGDLLDRDAIIQEERENLRRAQAEWQEKLRAAEIEISVERAKLARQRAEIEERLRAQGDAVPSETAEAAASKPDKTPSGRWLTRLGLKDPKSA